MLNRQEEEWNRRGGRPIGKNVADAIRWIDDDAGIGGGLNHFDFPADKIAFARAYIKEHSGRIRPERIKLTDIAVFETRKVPDPETSGSSLKYKRGWWEIEYPYTYFGRNRGEVKITHPGICDDFDN